MALEAGHVFGNYRLVKLIGEGGFGEVYLVENPLIHRRAAVKVLLPDLARNTEVVWRFLNEARAASAIRHPNIVDVLDAGATSDGAPYILMEYLNGESLYKRLVDRGRLPLECVLAIAEQACSALAAAHAAGIVHRDLKPENLFLVLPEESTASGELLKILDFGIAKIINDEANRDTMKTRAGLVMGSPAYMSPEQCTDTAQVDLRTDIYSLATILYQALAGRTPHEHHSPTQLMLLHLTADPPTLGELGIEVPAHVEDAIMRGLAREPVDRFANMGEFVGALRGDEPGIPIARSGAVASIYDRPSSKRTARPERTAILAGGSAVSAKKPAPARRRTPVPSPTTNTTFSSSAIETVTEAHREATPPQRSRSRRNVILGTGVLALCVLALVVGMTLKGRRSPARDTDHVPALAIQPGASPAAIAKPIEVPIPQLAQPALQAPPALPSQTDPHRGSPNADTPGRPAEADSAVRRRHPARDLTAEATEHPRRVATAKPSGVAKATPQKPSPNSSKGSPATDPSVPAIKHVKF